MELTRASRRISNYTFGRSAVKFMHVRARLAKGRGWTSDLILAVKNLITILALVCLHTRTRTSLNIFLTVPLESNN